MSAADPAVLFPDAMLERITRARVVAGFAIDDIATAVPLAKALLAGGIDVIELMLRTDAGIEAVREIAEHVPEMLIGVGTVLRPDQVAAVKAAGAHFAVSPGLNPSVVKAARDAGLPFAPGIATPSDVEAAIELGCRFLKLFPAAAMGGPGYLKSMSAPYAPLGIRYFPLGGVNPENLGGYLALDCVAAVGGSWIVKAPLVAAGDWAGLTARAADAVRIAAEA